MNIAQEPSKINVNGPNLPSATTPSIKVPLIIGGTLAVVTLVLGLTLGLTVGKKKRSFNSI